MNTEGVENCHLTIQKLEFSQPLVLEVKFLKEDSDKVLEECLNIFSRKNKVSANHVLAGNIQHEYEASSKLNRLFDQVFKEIIKHSLESSGFDIEFESKLTSCWVNFQEKYEFNPIHSHSGDYSFVYWAQIPYNLEDELNHPSSKKSRKPCPTEFNFVYTNILGSIVNMNIELDSNSAGKMVIFPAALKHSVYPFYTSDDYRISVSGNFTLRGQDGNKIELSL